MAPDFKKQLNSAVLEERKKLEEEALNKAEGMIKSLVYRDQPAHESFREELKAKIIDRRHAPLFMRFFQVKVFVPAMAFLLLLSLSVGAYQLGVFGRMPQLAKFLPKKEASQEQVAKLNTDWKNFDWSSLNLFKKQEPAAVTGESESAADTASAPVIKGGRKFFGFTLVKPVFAQFEEKKASPIASLPGDKVASTQLSNLGAFEAANKFSATQKTALAEDNFFLAENNIIGDQQSGLDDFTDTYDSLDGSNNIFYREPDDAVFITSDYALHLYHLLIDRSFQKIEETKLEPRLKEMTQVLFDDSLANYHSATSTAIKESYRRLATYYLVPLAILEADQGGEVGDLSPYNFKTFAKYEEALAAQKKSAAEGKPDILSVLNSLASDYDLANDQDEWILSTAGEELKLINDAGSISSSPLFSTTRRELINDYTQFTPRSHYTKNNILKAYFMAMMWYGRMGFALNSPEQTRDAWLITGQINSLPIGDKKLSDQWAEMMALIDFFVGESDDLTAFQYTEVMKKIFGSEVSDEEVVSDEMMKTFRLEAGRSLPGPKITSEIIDMSVTGEKTKEELLADTMQFRFMGQRFTPDAYVLNQFTQGAESADNETGQSLPSMPTALMPVSVIAPNNTVVKGYLDSWVQANALSSDKIIAKKYTSLVGEFLSLSSEDWNKNIYWSWLSCYRPLLGSYGQGYPFFMKGDDWQRKNLGTVLGSYTELKHDTLLYAKQSYAERGGGGDDEPKLPPVVKGYVEPDPVFWGKILALAKATQKGLADRGFLPDVFIEKYDNFISASEFFQELAVKELKNEKISDDDFEKLRTITALKLDYIAESVDGPEPQVKDRRAGIIADVHTDGFTGRVLYEATAKPLLLYVAVKDVNGARLTAGAVFDQYEFAGPLEKRLTDEDWQTIVYTGEGQMPARSVWTAEIVR